MAETIESLPPSYEPKWHWHNVQKDLVRQGGLEEKDVFVNPLTMWEAGVGGAYQGQLFNISWVADTLLMLSTREHTPELAEAFAKIVEYEPFARYREPDQDIVTVEWAKEDADARFEKLQLEGKLELTRLPE
ncbi:hypothetical protein ACFL1B_06230 [Nanoarchaeota archaeon]